MENLAVQGLGEALQCQQKSKTTITSLPPELLLIIFEFCYEDFKRDEESQPQLADPPWHYISAGLDPSSMRPTSTSELFDRYHSPTRFPFALAKVSLLWNDVLSMEPKYWTEIIYILGSCASPFEPSKMMQEYEGYYPRDMLLDFIVLSRKGQGHPERQGHLESSIWPSTSSMSIWQDRSQLTTILSSYLDNHFPQVRTVAIEACNGQSFPDIMGQWRSRATDADRVCLSSILLTHEADYSYTGCQYPRFESFNQTYNSLNTLSIHGLNVEGFYPLIVNGQISNLEHLVISDYTFSSRSVRFTEFLETLSLLHHLFRLKLQNIILRHAPGEIQTAITFDIEQLHLQSIPSLTLTELDRLCDFPDLEYLHLTNSVYQNVSFAAEVQIMEDVQIASLESEMGDWPGSTLWFGKYRGSSDDLLDMLRDYHQWFNTFRCPWMHTLYLYQIPQVSLKKLKKMVKSRNRGVNYGDPEWRTMTTFGPAMKKLSIDQCGIAPLTDEDVQWFSSMLVEFVYIP